MGLWGWIKDKAKRVVKWVVEKLDFLNKEVEDSNPVDENSSAREIERMQNLLQEYYRTYKTRAAEIEDACISYIDEYYTELLVEIKKNENIEKSIGLNNIERNQRKIRREIEGTIEDTVSRRISLDDLKCRQIVSMHRSDAKAVKIRVFCEDVLKDSRDKLSRKIRKTLDDQTDDINSFLEDYAKDNLNSVNRSLDEFKKLEKEMENNTFDKERAQVLPLYKLQVFNNIERQLGEQV